MASVGGQQSHGIIKQTSTAAPSRSGMTRPTAHRPGHLERMWQKLILAKLGVLRRPVSWNKQRTTLI